MISLRVCVALAVLIVGLPALLSVAEVPMPVAAQSASASPSPGPSPILIDPLDPRGGAGPNQVGAPLLALLAVVGAGLATAALTALYVKATRRA